MSRIKQKEFLTANDSTYIVTVSALYAISYLYMHLVLEFITFTIVTG